MIIGKGSEEVQTILQEIELESLKYNMLLNKGKCEVVAINTFSLIKHGDGTIVKQREKALYLGAQISDDANRDLELNSRRAKQEQQQSS